MQLYDHEGYQLLLNIVPHSEAGSETKAHSTDILVIVTIVQHNKATQGGTTRYQKTDSLINVKTTAYSKFPSFT
jgi:hypothetical protein